jgi:hypothetical protein
MHELFDGFSKMFPDDGKLITDSEARVVSMFKHIIKISQHFGDGIDYIEDMLRKQLSKYFNTLLPVFMFLTSGSCRYWKAHYCRRFFGVYDLPQSNNLWQGLPTQAFL